MDLVWFTLVAIGLYFGADRLLDLRSPRRVYRPRGCRRLKLLLRDYQFSDDIAFRFSNRQWPSYPLMADTYASWLHRAGPDDAFVGLFMDYETFGEHQSADTGILEFMRHLPAHVLSDARFSFATPSELAAAHEPVAELEVPDPISWADAERDLSAWREPWSTRLRRWVGRRRLLVTGVASALLVAVAALGVSTGLLLAAHRRADDARTLAEDNKTLAERARQAAEKERDAARRSLQTALRVIDRFSSRVNSDTSRPRNRSVETSHSSNVGVSIKTPSGRNREFGKPRRPAAETLARASVAGRAGPGGCGPSRAPSRA